MADEGGRIQGGIRALYAHYRLSDYKQTSMTFRDKTLLKEEGDETPLWFEGHMDWTFLDCQFLEPFFFGVEGARLEGDTREEFPPYGSNAVHFKNCDMLRYFKIAKNCVVIFENCTFTDEGENPKPCVTLEDNVKVEFRDCIFRGEKGPVISDYCNVHFLRCTFSTSKYCMRISDHCEVTMHNCSHSQVTEQTYITIDGDSLLDWYGENSGACGSTLSTMTISDRSIAKVYNHASFTSIVAPTFSVSGHSKLELRDIQVMKNTMAPVIQATDSYVYERNCELQQTTMAPTIALDNTTFRGETIGLVKSTMGHALAITNKSQMDIDGLEKATSVLQNGFDASADSKSSIINFENISSTLSIGANIVSDSKCVFQDGQEVISQLLYTTQMASGGWGIFKNVTKLCCGSSVAIEVNNGRFTDKGGQLRQGKQALRATNNSTIEIEDTSEKYYGKEEDCIAITDSTYDIRRVTLVEANTLKAFIGTNCQGVMSVVETIRSKEDDAVHISGTKGPLEWDNITLIESLQKRAMVVDGSLYGLRCCRVQTIRALQDDALVWDQTGGDTFFYEIDTIETEQGKAFHLNVTGRFWGEKIENITTQQGDVMEAFTSSGEITLKDIGTMSTQQGNVFNLRSDPHDLIRIDTVESMTTQQGQLFDGDSVKGQTILANIESASTQQGDIIDVSCGNEPSSFFRVVDNKSLTTQESVADAVGIKECANIQIHRNDSINAQEAKGKMVFLTGIGGGFGRIEVLDNVITTNKCAGGIWFEDSGACFLMGTSKSCEFKPQTCDDDLLSISNTSLTVKNYSAIEATSGTGYGVSFSAQVGNVLNIGKVGSIKHEKAAKFTGKGLTEISGLTKIEAVKEDGVEIADSMEIRWLADTQIQVLDQTKTALKITGTKRHNYFHKITAPQGKLTIENSNFSINEATFNFGDISITNGYGDFSELTATRRLDVVSSNVVFLDTDLNGDEDASINSGSVVKFYRGTIGNNTANFDASSPVEFVNVELTKTLVGGPNGIIRADVCTLRDIDTSAPMFLANTEAKAITHSSTLFANACVFTDQFKTSGTTGVILNAVASRLGFTFDADECGVIINQAYIPEGGMAGGDKGGYILNSVNAPDNATTSAITFASESGVICNRLVVGGDVGLENFSGGIFNYLVTDGNFGNFTNPVTGKKTGADGYILNHVTLTDGDFNFTASSGVVATWLKGKKLTLEDSSGTTYIDNRGGENVSDRKGLIAAYAHMADDFLVGEYSGAILSSGWLKGNTTIGEYGGLIENNVRHYGGNYPTGEGCIITISCSEHLTSGGGTPYLVPKGALDVGRNRAQFHTGYCGIKLSVGDSVAGYPDLNVWSAGGEITRTPSSKEWDL